MALREPFVAHHAVDLSMRLTRAISQASLPPNYEPQL